MTNKANELQIAYDYLYSKQIKTISKISVKNIKKACDKLLGLNAKINPTTVAAFIADIDNEAMFEFFNNNNPYPPVYQSINNNASFKAFIRLYQPPKDELINKDKMVPQYPTLGLDNKTKSYINILKHNNEALQRENKSLSDQLTTKTMRKPVSLLGSEENGAINNNEMVLIDSEESYPFDMSDLISIIQKIPKLADSFPHIFKIEERGGKQAMSIITSSKVERIFNSKDMEIITSCTDNLGNKQ